MVIHSAITTDMLTRSDGHVCCWSDVDYRGFVGIGLWYPYFYRKSIGYASKVDRKDAEDVNKQRVCAILRCCRESVSVLRK